MIAYMCEWCGSTKQPHDNWFLGYAAEKRTANVCRREFSLAERWTEGAAKHEFAVHFCCEEHSELYMRALFGPLHAAEERSRKRAGSTGKGAAGVTTAAGKRKSARKRAAKRPVEPPPLAFSEADVFHARALGIRLDENTPETA